MKATSVLFSTLAAALIATTSAHAASASVIYSFEGGSDGEYADTDLVMDASGNIYGTTVQGGQHASGTVWELSPNGGSYTHTVLYSFTGSSDGAQPYKGVTVDAQGNLLGTTVTGGGGLCEGGCGVVYKLTKNGNTWKQSVIYTFAGGGDGSGPGAGLTIDELGNVYGTTPTGGVNGQGTIYELSPKGQDWKFKVIHAFTGADGIGGSAGRLTPSNGSFYGTATSGGVSDAGTAYVLTPNDKGKWKYKVIYQFLGTPGAGFPYGGLTFDATGNAFGTTYYDGANDAGSVYELTPRDHGLWKEKLLYSFQNNTDGNSPISTLAADADGNLYGTTSAGGQLNDGTIFRMAQKGRRWIETIQHNFAGAPGDGASPYSGMVSDGHGHFFGATTEGGADDEGAIYEFTP